MLRTVPVLCALLLAAAAGCARSRDEGGSQGRTAAPATSAARRDVSAAGAAGSTGASAAAGSAGDGGAQSESAGAAVPSFKRVIAPWLEVHCASTKNCHGPAPAWTVDLDLRPSGAYRALVDEDAERREGKRVKPGDVEGSFLIAKLNGKLGRHEGKPMPLDPRTGRVVQPIPEDPDFIEHALKPWIAAGAPNN